MRKKGFTLLELLSVFVVFGVVASIAAISYGRYVKKSQQDYYKDAEITLRSAAESFVTYCASNTLADCITLPNVGSTKEVQLNILVKNGFMKPVNDQGNNNQCSGKVIIKNNGVGLNYDLSYKACLICSDYKSEECE